VRIEVESILALVSDLVLDAESSTVRINTFAEGLLARLAHDLELTCGYLSGTASRNDADAPGGTASIEAPLHGLALAGVRAKNGNLDERGLSPSEQRDCLAKMQHDVFHARPDAVVRLEVHLDGGSARVRLVPPNGRAVESVIRTDVHPDGNGLRGLRAKGSFEISLAAIGSEVVKGPLNAFRVKDKVKITFDVRFAPAPTPADPG
jgi:hypothetical protein